MASATEAPSELPFTDVTPEDANYAAILQAYNDGLICGCGDGTFRPNGVLTRAELYQTLAKACGVETGEAVGHWGGKAILHFQEQGVIPAETLIDATYCSAPINRAEAVSAIYAVYAAKGIVCNDVCPSFTDREAIPAQYLPNIENAYKAGLISASKSPGGRFYFFPNGKLYRGELCEIMANAREAAYLSDNGSAKVTAYIVEGNGFEVLEDEGAPLVGTISIGDTIYYSLNDTLEALEGKPTETSEGVSQLLYYGSYDFAKYKVPASFVKTGRGTYEFSANKYIWHDGSSLVSGNLDTRSYVITDGEIYVEGQSLSVITRRTFANKDGSLNILMGDDDLTFIAKSGSLSNEEKQSLTDSMWLLYNTYAEGFDIVTSYVKGVRSASDSYMDTIGDGNALACAPFRGNTIMWREGHILHYSVEYNAGVLVHEATHFQRFTHGDLTENQATLNQGKAYYYIQNADYPISYLDSLLKSHTLASDPYHHGTVLLQQWVEAQSL